ncbi:MAG: Trk system potassium transporter TrkA [Phycisphaerae bacterium]|nr:Trk system potassium transporter TrkA [Phycisphaerae bacterium]
MDIIIVGAGQVGRHTAEVFAAAGHNIVMIDRSVETLETLEDALDVRTLQGPACDARILRDAGVEDADLLVAATDSDETNLLCATIAKSLGVKKTIARAHHSTYHPGSGTDYAARLNIDALVFPEYLTAMEVARFVRNPGAMAIEHFARGKIEMQQLAVADDAEALGKPLEALRGKLPPGTLIGTVERGNDILIPSAKTVLEIGDIITLLCETARFEDAQKFFLTGGLPRRSMIVMGGSAMGVWLAREFRGRNFSIRLFETNRARAEELSNKLEHVTVMQGDPTDAMTFNEERIKDADVFVAVSDSDEHNILGALQAKSMGVRRSIVVIQQPTYLNLLEQIGLDRAFSPRITASREILRIADESPLQLMATLAEGVADVYQITPDRDSAAVGQPLRSVPFPAGLMVAALQRGSSVHVPTATDRIDPGDSVVVIAKHGMEKELRRFFLGR